MTKHRMSHCAAAVLAVWFLLCTPAAALAQDTLSRAKTFYASADYEEALQLLETLKGKTANTEASAYQVFCLVALGRRDEARTSIEAIVRADPLFRPSEAQVSPRIRTFFDEVRKPLLPEMARQAYAKGKAAFDQKDWSPALAEFERTITLTEEIDGAEPGTADVRTLAAGFRDLTRAALQPAPPPPPAPVAASAAPAEPMIYGIEHADVKPPVALSQKLPLWRPATAEARMSFSGAIELVIGEDGTVRSASLLDSVHPRYDAPLLEAARVWTFRAATKNGVPVKYHYTMAIHLGK